MNILWVDLERQWRGGQKQALLALAGLRARGHGAELVAVEGGELGERAGELGIPVHATAAGAARLRAAGLLRSLLARPKFDLVHANEAHALTAAWLARTHGGVPVIAGRRVAYPLQRSPFAFARYRAARRILAVSQFVAESVIASGIPRERVAVVYDGVEIPPLLSEDERGRARERWGVAAREALLGCVGYLLPEKGHELAIHALAHLLAQGRTCRLLLAGDGPLRAALESLARRLGVAGQMRFAGLVENVEQVYAALDVFVFPSHAEPLGSALLEAMAYGLPSVALGSGGVPEIISDGVSGMLAELDEPARCGDAIAAKIARLLDDAALAGSMGRAARQRIEQEFSRDRMVAETLRVYEEALSR